MCAAKLGLSLPQLPAARPTTGPSGQLLYGRTEFRVGSMEKLTFGSRQVVFGNAPDKGGPLLELSRQVVYRFFLTDALKVVPGPDLCLHDVAPGAVL